jgi:hypothetical protein
VQFVEQRIDLEFCRRMPSVDTVICLNLLHHAGDIFDASEVARLGWQRYAEQWLVELRQKCRVAILGLGLKQKKPLHWDVPKHERAAIFTSMAEGAGWKTLYSANVEEMHTLGIAEANKGSHVLAPGAAAQPTASRPWRPVRELLNLFGRPAPSKRQNYHFYIFERG